MSVSAKTNDQLAELRRRVAEIVDLGQAAAVLGWDQETMMPPKGAHFRATQKAALHGIIHERFVDPKVGQLLTSLENASAQKELAELDRAFLRVIRRDYDRATKLPDSLVKDLAIATTEGVESWHRARSESRWDIFAPDLRKIVELKRQEARCVGFAEHPYDALLDEYEPGATCAQLIPLFDDLRRRTVSLLERIDRSPRRPSRAPLTQTFDRAKQATFGERVLRRMGFDFEAGREDVSAHPFTTSFGPTDVRITTRYDEHDLAVAFYATIHEGGHGLYDQGIPIDLARTGLGECASLGIHESQSRLWENLIGRSIAFWRFALPELKTLFPAQVANVTPEDMFGAVNQVERSLIRVEADEITYNLHIILRFEIERRIIAGEVDVDDLPSLWNRLTKDYLGIDVPNDAMGVLQDTHWASGLFGYFPTYSLGNLYAAQLWATIRREIPDVDERISRGEFAPILAWLRDRIHRYGRRHRPGELIERATGEAPNPVYLTRYLGEKYGQIYGF